MKAKIDPDSRREELQDARRLFVLKKKRSPHHIEFIEEPSDDWFVYVVKVKNTSKKFESFSAIIAKDVVDWMTFYKNLGWEVEKTS